MNPAEGTTTAPRRPSAATLAKLVNTSSLADRRSSSRRPPRGTVAIEVRKGSLGLGRDLAVLALDISEGGVRVIISGEIERGSEVEVRISAFGLQKQLKSLGVVRWVMPLDDDYFCIGVQFDKRLPHSNVTTLVKP
jgi:hypothetical protein